MTSSQFSRYAPAVAAPKKRISTTERNATIIAAALPFSQLVELKLVGTLFLQDVISTLLLFALFILVPNRFQLLKPLRPLLLLSLVWLLGAIVSDILVNSSTEDLARGWSKILLFMIHATSLWLLSRGSIRILSFYLISTGIVYIIQAEFFPDPLQQIDPWKFGLGSGMLLISCGIGSILYDKGRHLRHLAIAGLVLTGLISLMLNSRALFAISFLGSLYYLGTIFLMHRQAIGRLINRRSFFLIILVGVFVGQAMVSIYGMIAEQGFLGEDARQKYQLQTTGDLNILQGGRPETLVSLTAIKDSPIIGHGSWARDRYYTNMYFDELQRRGLVAEEQWFIYNEAQRDLIPSHSHIIGAWVEAGILGVPIWIYAILLAFNCLYAAVKLRSLPSLFTSTIAFYVMWDTLFSPFGADARILKAAQLCVLVSAVYALRGQQGRKVH